MGKDYGVLVYSKQLVLDVMKLKNRGFSRSEISGALGLALGIVDCASVAHNAGLQTILEYQDSLVRPAGYSSYNAYNRSKRGLEEMLSKKELDPTYLPAQLEFDELEALVANEAFTSVNFVHRLDDERHTMVLSHLNSLLQEFPERERDIFKAYFFEGLTYECVGKKQGITKERTRQIVEEMLPEIKAMHEGVSVPREKRKSPCEGEELLIRSISHIPGFRSSLNYWVDFVNKLFHDGFRMRTRQTFQSIIYSSKKKKRDCYWP